MTAEITPPPIQPLHLVLWRGLEPGYYLVLGLAFLGGFVYVLLDVSWWRLLLAVFGFLLLVILMLPYRGLRLWKWGWLRLGHWWAVLLASVQPARQRQLAALVSSFLEAAPAQEQGESVARTGRETRLHAPPAFLEESAPGWNPAWTAAWRASAASPPQRAPASSVPLELPASRSIPVRNRQLEWCSQLSRDELDGMPAPSERTPPFAFPLAEPEGPAEAPGDPSRFTLRSIRAWGQPAGGTRRAE